MSCIQNLNSNTPQVTECLLQLVLLIVFVTSFMKCLLQVTILTPNLLYRNCYSLTSSRYADYISE